MEYFLRENRFLHGKSRETTDGLTNRLFPCFFSRYKTSPRLILFIWSLQWNWSCRWKFERFPLAQEFRLNFWEISISEWNGLIFRPLPSTYSGCIPEFSMIVGNFRFEFHLSLDRFSVIQGILDFLETIPGNIHGIWSGFQRRLETATEDTREWPVEIEPRVTKNRTEITKMFSYSILPSSRNWLHDMGGWGGGEGGVGWRKEE